LFKVLNKLVMMNSKHKLPFLKKLLTHKKTLLPVLRIRKNLMLQH